MYHYRKTRLTYSKHNANDVKLQECNFCRDQSDKIVKENDTMYVIPNRVSYDMFESMRVLDHLMVIPKKHHETMATFDDNEMRDAMKIMGEYEAQGYNVYARGMGSVSRSVKHQHTHLLKLDNKPSNLVIYARKPYFMIAK
jgi:diadenosine tetraphosphate (Ap4A) HIT family hydrolase